MQLNSCSWTSPSPPGPPTRPPVPRPVCLTLLRIIPGMRQALQNIWAFPSFLISSSFVVAHSFWMGCVAGVLCCTIVLFVDETQLLPSPSPAAGHGSVLSGGSGGCAPSGMLEWGFPQCSQFDYHQQCLISQCAILIHLQSLLLLCFHTEAFPISQTTGFGISHYLCPPCAPGHSCSHKKSETVGGKER